MSPSANAQRAQAPKAEIKPTELTKHGHTRVDNYFWLRSRTDKKVLDYLKAENEYLDAMMADTKPLEEKLYKETIARLKQDESSVPYKDNGYEYYSRFEEGKQYRIYCRRRDQDNAPEEILLDVNKLAEGHAFCSVAGVDVNPSNDLAAFAVDMVGRRMYTLHVKELSSGKVLEDEIPRVSRNFEWAEDGRTLFYTRQDPETLRWYQIYRHKIGTDPKTDELVYEEKDDRIQLQHSEIALQGLPADSIDSDPEQ